MRRWLVSSGSASLGGRRKPSLADAPTIAIVGCGAIAESFYLPAIARYPDVVERLVLVDSSEMRARKLASKFSVRRYCYDYREVLDHVDGAIVAVPHALHYSISMDFLTRGVHVLCEKPLAVSASEAREMVAQAGESGATLCVNNTRRLFPAYGKVRELLSDGIIGRPLSIKYVEGHDFSWPSASGFRFNARASRRGVLLDTGAHVLDAICWWLGEKPELVSCENDSFGGSEAVTSVKFEHNKCCGEVKLSWLSKLQNSYRIVGTLGIIESGIEDWQTVTVISSSGVERGIGLKAKERHYNDFAHRIVENYLDVLSKGRKPLVPASDVIASIELIEECYRAATRMHMPWYDILGVPRGS